MDISATLRAINVDVLYEVAERTFLSPFFTFWIPVIAVCQNSRAFFKASLALFLLVSLRSIVRWSSRAWSNRRWSRGQVDWSEQLVVITGGSDGLGRVLVETLLLKHVSVIVLDIKPFGDHLAEEEGDVVFYECDISDPVAVQNVADRIRKEHGSPTIVINNAGCVKGKLLIDLEPSDVQQTFAVNTLSHFYLLKAFLPDMLQRKTGHIVTISSILGQLGVAQSVDYCASKAASILLHQGLRQELDARYGCHGIRTTLVCTGKMTTKMFEKIRPQNQFFFPEISPHDLIKKILRSIDNQESNEIFVPFYTNWVPILRLTPSWVLDLVHYLSGSNEAMRSF